MAAPMVKTIFFRFQITNAVVRQHVIAFSACHLLQSDPTQSRTMQKIMKKKNRKNDRSFFVPPFTQPTVQNRVGSGKPAKTSRKFSEGMWRRATQVSSVLSETISQIIGGGELDIYVEVTKVEALPDMAYVNVYWEDSGVEEKDNETQRLLEEKAGLLRQLLMDAHVLSTVPKVVFVKDLSASRQRQVEELLRKADLGPDYIRNELGYVVSKKEPVDSMDSDGPHDFGENKCSDDSKFRQDLYGLRRDVLLQKVLEAKSASHKRPVVIDNTFSFSPSRHESKKLLSQLYKKEKVPRSGKIKNVDAREYFEEPTLQNNSDYMYEDERSDLYEDDSDLNEEDSDMDECENGIDENMKDVGETKTIKK